MNKYCVKDLLQVADDFIISYLYAAYGTVRNYSSKTLEGKFAQFWSQIDNIEPCDANILALGIRHDERVDAVFYDKGALAQAYTPRSPLLQLNNCSALPFDEVLRLCHTEPFLPQLTYEQLPWSVILGAEVNPVNADDCGLEEFATDIIHGMTAFGFTAEENRLGWTDFERNLQENPLHRMSIATITLQTNLNPQQARECALRQYLDSKIAEYRTVHEYLSGTATPNTKF